ncbi:hypothetical protein PR048_020621 [Dryococelus australis]|uniref:Transglutaminase-like domain-containing protein n=1 Tax=Dryococelus australis TaxID=614101 RepID=A0ABQ9H6T0_9NEOP|nr:hypothetical protein PR048_020621 [Dryococelus australis]
MRSSGRREIPEKTRRPTASSSTIPTCENAVTRPGFEPGSPWWEASVLIAQPSRPPDLPKRSCPVEENTKNLLTFEAPRFRFFYPVAFSSGIATSRKATRFPVAYRKLSRSFAISHSAPATVHDEGKGDCEQYALFVLLLAANITKYLYFVDIWSPGRGALVVRDWQAGVTWSRSCTREGKAVVYFMGGSGPAAPILADQQARPADVRCGARQTHPRRSEGKPSQTANMFSTSYGTVGLTLVRCAGTAVTS